MNVVETANSSDGLDWFKSSYSGGAGGECLEVATCSHAVHVRDSKDTARLGLAVGQDAWAIFVAYAVDQTI
ncbi:MULTISPECIES: DUF397 domain-containing protein [Streptomyces]|uniref:DUF397 domain-containing protein n=1 Tax=Streptomyces TaxID=1883 RepID=UPI0029BA3F59|nr:DUF397 domain-containing protein [Streptomyces europaeiscabiei]MDX3580228.1 DUF397 domain-containing protein [Streptomyces europaeiscabiei]